jgi:metal-responsive CopG/Arc/MetJ family transcriptional regulator
MKVAISIPDTVFDAAERLAKQRRMPRSQLFAEALQEYLVRHGTEAITAKLDQVYEVENSTLEKPLAAAQYASIAHERPKVSFRPISWIWT